MKIRLFAENQEEIDTIAYHSTSRKNIESILKNGIRCTPYKKNYHPLADTDKCFVFGYPPNGLDQDLEFWPHNAEIKNEDLDDKWYVAFIARNATIGDLRLEGIKTEYLKRTYKYETYLEKELRYMLHEPEVVVVGTVGSVDVINALPYSETVTIFNKCKEQYNMNTIEFVRCFNMIFTTNKEP